MLKVDHVSKVENMVCLLDYRISSIVVVGKKWTIKHLSSESGFQRRALMALQPWLNILPTAGLFVSHQKRSPVFYGLAHVRSAGNKAPASIVSPGPPEPPRTLSPLKRANKFIQQHLQRFWYLVMPQDDGENHNEIQHDSEKMNLRNFSTLTFSGLRRCNVRYFSFSTGERDSFYSLSLRLCFVVIMSTGNMIVFCDFLCMERMDLMSRGSSWAELPRGHGSQIIQTRSTSSLYQPVSFVLPFIHTTTLLKAFLCCVCVNHVKV